MWLATIKKPGGQVGWKAKFEQEADANLWLENHKGPMTWGGDPSQYVKELTNIKAQDDSEKEELRQRRQLRQLVKGLKQNDLDDIPKLAKAIADIVKVLGLDK